jgi:cell division protein FtsL
MNAAARQINQSTLFSGHLGEMRLSKELMMQLILLLSVLGSALAVVYSTNNYRETFTELQMAERTQERIQLRWGQLLLEQASLSTPARVQELATEKFQMVLPTNNQTVMLRIQ